ncbi:MAG TPA: tRNA 2-thiocytidine(32) synthetase TtcA [Clostridiaceae bacterium]|nr:tRNA 2-thiocytidine(32) synthetase TtcA [Clostridiaceae bacterium]
MLRIKRILGLVRKAIQDFNMVQEGDKIAVGVSGGKDSLTLLVALRKLQDFFPAKFKLEAITLTMGIGEADLSGVIQLCNKIGVNHTIEETLIGRIVFDVRQEKNPCSLCANLRRGALNNAAKRLGCNKVALAHNKDDVIETLMLSTIYEGRIHTFSPVTYLERKDLYVIRPLIYAEESEIRSFVKSQNLKVVPNPCQANGKTKRQYIKDLLHGFYLENRGIKNNIFGAIKRSGIDGWH